MNLLPTEDSYGLAKRFAFLAEEIERCAPRRVLDLGCGTGANLTVPLAQRFPHVHFTGIDSDAVSIAYARRTHTLENLEFSLEPGQLSCVDRYDLIIASEVLEHVEDPDTFLVSLRACLTAEGTLLVTVPNGYGPFEWASLLEALLQVSGLYALLRRLRRPFGGRAEAPPASDTLAVSPHVNFFSHAELARLFASHGMERRRYLGRTFLCGFGFDQLLRGKTLLRWNARIADHLPPQLVSDWMFVFRPRGSPGPGSFRRGVYARLRRRLNYRRYGLAVPAADT